jgi:hypothetical protein
MLAERGSHFDSDLLDLFLSSLPDGGSVVPTTRTGEFRTLMGGK